IQPLREGEEAYAMVFAVRGGTCTSIVLPNGKHGSLTPTALRQAATHILRDQRSGRVRLRGGSVWPGEACRVRRWREQYRDRLWVAAERMTGRYADESLARYPNASGNRRLRALIGEERSRWGSPSDR